MKREKTRQVFKWGRGMWLLLEAGELYEIKHMQCETFSIKAKKQSFI
jgi:hypothetical protein